MQFNSSVFLLAFLPCALLAYYIVPWMRAKNYVLLAFSLAFYAWGDPGNIALLVVAILANYAMVRAMDRATARSARKAMLAFTVIADVGLLAVFKYTGFVCENIQAAAGVSFNIPSIALPLGISYFTLKLVTYAVDVYRGNAQVQTNLCDLALYASMFPALTAGPIVKYQTVEGQLRNRRHGIAKFAAGARLFCIGLSKKVLLSNTVALLASSMLGHGGEVVGAVGAWGGLIAYAFQLYFDFSGYSDMAIGLGKMFGFSFEKNFNYPYISRTVTEFWRRWHISLSTFFREYIYIPMGGSRVATPRFVLNMATVWLLTGIWHGAAWNFIWWGLFYLAVLLFEKFVLSGVIDRLPSLVRHVYVILVFLFGWCIFWITDVSALGTYILALFGRYGLTGAMTYWQIGVWQYLPLLAICAIASTPLAPLIRTNLERWTVGLSLTCHPKGIGIKDVATDDLASSSSAKLAVSSPRGGLLALIQAVSDVALIALLALSIVSIVSGSFSPVIYAAF